MTSSKLTYQAPPELGGSWLASVPDGACVLSRAVTLYVVAAVEPDHVVARVSGRHGRRLIDLGLVPVADRSLLRVGARFWLVTERVLAAGCGRPEWATGVRVQRPGVTAEQAFTGGEPR